MINIDLVEKHNLDITELTERLDAFETLQNILYSVHNGDIEAYMVNLHFAHEMSSFEMRLMFAKVLEIPFDETQMSERDKNTCQKIAWAIGNILPYSKLIEKEMNYN